MITTLGQRANHDSSPAIFDASNLHDSSSAIFDASSLSEHSDKETSPVSPQKQNKSNSTKKKSLVTIAKKKSTATRLQVKINWADPKAEKLIEKYVKKHKHRRGEFSQLLVQLSAVLGQDIKKQTLSSHLASKKVESATHQQQNQHSESLQAVPKLKNLVTAESLKLPKKIEKWIPAIVARVAETLKLTSSSKTLTRKKVSDITVAVSGSAKAEVPSAGKKLNKKSKDDGKKSEKGIL